MNNENQLTGNYFTKNESINTKIETALKTTSSKRSDMSNNSSSSNKQSYSTSQTHSYTIDDIVNQFVTKRIVDRSNGYDIVMVKVSWSKLLQFINNVLGYQVPKDSARNLILNYGTNDYIDLFSVKYDVRKLCSFYMFKKDIRNCKKGPLNEGNITDNDIYWDNLIALLSSKYGIQVKKWQLFSTLTDKSIDISKIIERIQCKIPDTFKVVPR